MKEQDLIVLALAYWPYLLGLLAVVVVLAAWYAARVLRRMRVQPASSPQHVGDRPSNENEAPDSQGISILAASPAALKKSFEQALKTLKGHIAGRNYRYEVPWFVMVGESQAGKTTILRNTGLREVVGHPTEERGIGTRGVNWWFFDKAVVLDVGGDVILRRDGRMSDEKGWDAILRLLQTYRPERPLDGVILTIPARDLLPSRAGNSEAAKQAQERGERIYRKLRKAQRMLGMNFPVYVLVSQCDEVPGFNSFCRELPDSLRDDIVGWSSPYALDAAYSPEWIGEAFKSVEQELLHTQLKILAGGSHETHGDGVFIFPSELLSMAESLQAYLNQIFQQSAYHQSFYLRGMYFCGAEEPNPSSGESPIPQGTLDGRVAQGRDTRLLFLKHLFADRIFPERAVAKPDTQAFFSKNRVALLAQGLAVVGSFALGSGLWYAADRLSSYERLLVPILTEVRDDLIEMSRPLANQADSLTLGHSAVDLLKGVTQASAINLRSAFIPSSWFVSLQNQLLSAMTLGYRELVVNAIAPALKARMERVLSGASLDTVLENEHPLGTSVEQMPEYVRFNQYVRDLIELEKNLKRYRALQHKEEGELEYLDALMQYLFDLKLTKDLQRHPHVFREAIAGADLAPLAILPAQQERAKAMVWDLGQQFLVQAFDENRVLQELQDLTGQFDSIDQASRTTQGLGALRTLWSSIEETQVLLQSAEARWLAREHLDLGHEFEETLTLISQSAFLDGHVSHEIQLAGEGAFARLTAQLKSLEAGDIGPLLDPSFAQFGLDFSPGVMRVKEGLAAVFDLEFMKSGQANKQMASALIPRTRLMWDVANLGHAIQLHQDYAGFREAHDLEALQHMDRVISRVMRQRLNAVMRDVVARAQAFEPWEEGANALRTEDDVRAEVESLKTAEKTLENLLAIFEREGFDDSFWDLLELLAMQASDLLEHVDQLLDKQGAYAVKGGTLVWWNGQRPLALQAYDVESLQGLKTFLAAQRARIDYLAREYAEPLLAVLMKSSVYQDLSGGQRVLASKWQGILESLDAFDKKKPGNSLSELERFILGPLAETNLSNCLEGERFEPLSNREGDYFRQAHVTLIQQMDDRCQLLTSGEVLKGYEKIERFFNQKLAGRFPFGDPDEARDIADYQTIRDFYRLFDEQMARGLGTIEQNRQFGLSRHYAAEFLEHLRSVRRFFGHFLDAKGHPAIPVFDLDVEFRTNQRHETQGNQILDWMMRVGKQTFRIRDGKSKGRWVWGDPVSLVFRWAKDAPTRPSRDQRGPHVFVKDETVTFHFQDSWSLLRLLMRQAGSPADFDRLRDPHPHTIKFVIPTVSVVEEGAGKGDRIPSGEEAQVFVRVGLRSPDHKEALELPVFPEVAPPLGRTIASYRKAE